MKKRVWALVLLSIALICITAVMVINLPPVHERLAWQLGAWQSEIYYFFTPPGEHIFTPQAQMVQINAIVAATLTALAPSLKVSQQPPSTPIPTMSSPTPTTQPDRPTATPLPTSTAIPAKIVLAGITHEYQKMNNCGPATLSMALSYWGWQGNQVDTRSYLRPNYATVDDKSVTPREMAAFVEQYTPYHALVRFGGDIETLKRLIAAGYPVIIEKGFQPPKEDWMGHYQLLNGYNDRRNRFITQDSYAGADYPLSYKTLEDHWWRDFNYVYILIYPEGNEEEVMNLLGAHADPSDNARQAERKALQETEFVVERDLFFAWFAVGTNRVALGEYHAAAQAYDQAFAILAKLPAGQRPWRTMWYQSGPYEAYYHTQRYQDVIQLANTTMSTFHKPILEEAYYWRGMAKEARGKLAGAIKDYRTALKLNPNFEPAITALDKLENTTIE